MGVSESSPEPGTELSEELVLRALRNADETLGAGRYEAGKLDEGRKVVVKVFKDLQSADAQRIKRRLTTLCHMEQHAHLLLPTGWCQQGARCYVLFDMLDSQDAGKRLALSRRGEKEFAWADRLRLAAAVASALSHLRSCTLGSPHLNLKLSSVLFDRTGQVKLADPGFEGEMLQSASSTLSKDAEVRGEGLAAQQVAELRDLGRLLLALLLPDDAAVEAAASCAARGIGADGEALEQQLSRLRGRGRAVGVPEAALLKAVLGSALDRSAAWPLPFACALAEVALSCASAQAEASKPPPGMASIAGKLLQQCQTCVSQAGVPEKSKADFSGFYAGFECTYSSSLDLRQLSHEMRRWPFEPGQPPWMVGRQHQLELLSRVVPDRHLCSSIGRTHFELWPEPGEEKPTLRLRPLSPNPLRVDGHAVCAGESGPEDVSIRDGSSVSFCFQGEVFLTLQFLIRRGVEAAPTQEALPLDAVPTVARSSPAAYALLCDRLAGEVVDHLPKEERKISISPDGLTSVGRQCQPGFFENLQKMSRSQWVFVGYVSRTHFQVTGLSEDLPPSKQRFEIANCSSNPIVLGGRELPTRARHVIQVGDTIELIAQDGTRVSTYLRFRVQWLGQSRSTSSLASRATAPGTILLDRQDSMPRESPKKRAPFQLCLAGSAVLKGLPDAHRVVDAGDNGLTIGRAHQRELHEKAFVDGVLGYISRDHFSIKCSRDGAFSLVPLSQNPIWLSRRGRLQRLMVGDPPPRLEDGDAVLLFTGAEDLSPEGPGSFGSLRWVFRLRSS